MNIPTYYDGLVKNNLIDGSFVTMWLSNDQNGDWYEIYYYGKITANGYIDYTDEAPSLVVAKSIQSGNEIVLFDGAIHGYDNMFVFAHSQSKLSNRKLVKLGDQPVKIKISVEYSIDYDSEKDGYNFSAENNVVLINGNTMTLDDVKRNGITWLVITLINKNNEEKCIIDNELA